MTDFEVRSSGLLWRSERWTRGSGPSYEGGEENVSIEYFGGYLVPEVVQTWAAALSLAVGDWIRPTSPALSPYLFEVKTGGTTPGAEPTWPANPGDDVSGGGLVVLTARRAVELPAFVSEAAWLAVKGVWEGMKRPLGVSSIEGDGFRASYLSGAFDSGLPANVERSLDLLAFSEWGQ